MDSKVVRKRVEARKEAEEALAFISETITTLTDDQQKVFWEHIRKKLSVTSEKTEKNPTKSLMTDKQSRAFGQSLVEFGKYNGTKVDDVPLDYWLWLDSQSDFRKDLRGYLTSNRIQKEQKEPEEPKYVQDEIPF